MCGKQNKKVHFIVCSYTSCLDGGKRLAFIMGIDFGKVHTFKAYVNYPQKMSKRLVGVDLRGMSRRWNKFLRRNKGNSGKKF